MKRFVSVFALAVIAVATFFVGCADREESRAIESDVVLFLDAKQVLEKSGLLDELAPLKGLAGEALAMELEEADKEFVKSIVENLDNSGITFTQPVYVGADLDEFAEPCNIAFVAEVNNSKSIDRILDLAGIEFVIDGSNRRITLDDEVMVGYNNKRFVVAIADENNSAEAILTKKLATPSENLSIFGARDLAIYMKTKALLEAVLSSNNATIAEMRNSYWDEDIAQYESMNDIIKDYLDEVSEQDYILSGLASENGRIVLDLRFEDMPFNAGLATKVNNDNLAYLSGQTLGVINIAMDGPAVAQFIEEEMTSLEAEMSQQEYDDDDIAEVNIMMGIVLDVVKEFTGDITIAINDFKQNRYNESVDAIAMMQVASDYLITNVSTLAPFMGIYLDEVKENMYSLDVNDGNTAYVGHTNNMFYLGINETPSKVSNSAAKSRWMKDVTDSYGYFVVDAQNIIKKYRYVLMGELDYEVVDFMSQADYLYVSAPTTQSFELVLVLTDKELNPLKMIVDFVMENDDFDLMSLPGEMIMGFGDDYYEDYYYEDYYEEDYYVEEYYEEDSDKVERGKALIDEMLMAIFLFDEEEVERIALEVEALDATLTDEERAEIEAYAEEVTSSLDL